MIFLYAYILEVFSLSLCMKMWKFSIARGQRIALIPCIRIGVVTRSVSLPYAIRVWGIASFILAQVFPQPSYR